MWQLIYQTINQFIIRLLAHATVLIKALFRGGWIFLSGYIVIHEILARTEVACEAKNHS